MKIEMQVMSKNLHGKYLFFDLETNGFQMEILQFGWIVAQCTANGINVIEEHEHIVSQPDNFKLDMSGFRTHKISLEKIQSEGTMNIKQSLQRFIQKLNNCNFICGFNIKRFDLPKIFKNCQQAGIDYFNKQYVYTNPNWKICDMLDIARRYLKHNMQYTRTCALQVSYPMVCKDKKIDNDKYHGALYDSILAFEMFNTIYNTNLTNQEIIYNCMYNIKTRKNCNTNNNSKKTHSGQSKIKFNKNKRRCKHKKWEFVDWSQEKITKQSKRSASHDSTNVEKLVTSSNLWLDINQSHLWTENDVVNWLICCGNWGKQYISGIISNGIDARMLLDMKMFNYYTTN